MNWVLSGPSGCKVGCASGTPPSDGSGMYVLGPEQVLEAHISYMNTWPKCPWSPLLLRYLLSPSLHLWPRGECLMVRRRSREGVGLPYRWLGTTRHSTQEWVAAALQPLSETSHKDGGEGKSVCAELWAVQLVEHFAWEEKWPMSDSVLIHGCTSGLAGRSGTWKEHDW